MKFSISKKIVLAVVIPLAILFLFSCSNENINIKRSTQKIEDKSNPVEEFNTFTQKSVIKDPFGKYEPEIDISFVRAVDEDLASNVLPRTPGETVEDNRWLKLYKKELGINIKYDWTVRGGYPEDAYIQKINFTLASGRLPDVIAVTSSQLKQLADLDMIEDMTQYYNDYASPLTKYTYTQEGTSVLDSATFDGKLMGIPNVDSSIESAQFIWIRADWLKKLGLEPPKTMDDLLKISEAFTFNDPDGNGKDDTYGIAIMKDLFNGCIGLEGFFAGYHSYPGIWLENDTGKLVYGSIQPETKVALEKLAELYKSGQLDKEFGIKDVSKAAGAIAEGKVGITFGEQWNPIYPLSSNFNNDNSADWQGYPLVSADDKPIKVPLKFRTNLYFAVRKGYEHPEAVVKMINLYLEKNWGATNEFTKYYMPPENSSVSVWKFSPVTPCPPHKNLNAFLAIEKARKNNDMSVLKGEARAIQDNIEAYARGDKSFWGWEKIYGVNGVYNVLKQYIANNSLLLDKFTSAPTNTMVQKKTALDKYEKEVFIRIIMGDVDIDEFDKFVNNWKKLGGDAIVKEVNEWYKSLKN